MYQQSDASGDRFAVEMRNPEDMGKHRSHVFPLSTERTSRVSVFLLANENTTAFFVTLSI